MVLFGISQYRVLRGHFKDSFAPLAGSLVLGLSFLVDFTQFDRWKALPPAVVRKPGQEKKIHFGVAAVFLVFITALMARAILHPSLIISGFDMSSYYPYRIYWIKSLLEGDPAFWNPYFKLGMPFFSWPTVVTASPFNLLYFLLPYNYAVTWEVFFHFFLSAFGFYLLLRLLGAGWKGAFLSGMAYTFGGYFMARTYQGEVWLWFTCAWAPWIVWSAERFLREKRLFWIAMTSLFCAFCYFEGHPQITEYTLMILAFYLVGAWLFRGTDFKTFLKVSLGSLLGFVTLSAMLLIPQSNYVHHSNRWEWHYPDIMENYVTPDALPIFLNPFRGSHLDPTGFHTVMGYHEVGNYIGYIPLALFIAGLFFFRKVPRIFWMSVMAIFFALMAMGASNPFSKSLFDFFYHYFPFFNHHRTIGRLMIIPLFFMVCCSGLMFDYFEERLKAVFKGRNFWVAFWIPLLALGATTLDLWRYSHHFIGLVDPQNYTDKKMMFSDRVMEKIMADPSYPRIQPEHDNVANLTYKLAQPMVFPEDTLLSNVARYSDLMHDDWNTPMSDLVGMKYVYSEKLFPHPTERWQPLLDNTVINTKVLPRAFVAGGYHVQKKDEMEDVVKIRSGAVDCSKEVLLYDQPKGLGASQPEYLGAATITRYSNREMELKCDIPRAGVLFMSDPYYPGWKAWVDGKETEIVRANRAFRALVLDQPGAHLIRMAYRPWDLKVGFSISALGWLGWAFIVLRRRKLKIG